MGKFFVTPADLKVHESPDMPSATLSSPLWKPTMLSGAVILFPLLFGALQWPQLSVQSSLVGNLSSFFPDSLLARVSSSSVSDGTPGFEAMRNAYATACPEHAFRTHIFSYDPLIIYVEDYLSKAETDYLLNLAVPHYIQSPVSKGHRLETYDKEVRSSMSAVLPDDPVVSCIEKRSVSFQGWMPTSHLEDIQVVKYGVSDHFRPHFDWFEGMANPRLSTFFVYLACDTEDGTECQGGATQFPDYTGQFSSRWCKFIDCEDDSDVGGVAFKPAVGNAVFWENLYPNGTGHPGVWHAGMPVKKGRKVGLNIFTRRNRVDFE